MRFILRALASASMIFASAAFAEPIKINNPEKLDSVVMDSDAPVFFVICRGAEQCDQTVSLLKEAEGERAISEVFANARKHNELVAKIVFANTADLPILVHEWDEQDKGVCLHDPKKTQDQCNDLAYPIFILKHGIQTSGSTQIAAGVEELHRGFADKSAVINMIIAAQGPAGQPD